MVGIVGFVDVPIIILAITLWRTQHPSALIFQGDLSPAMLCTLIVSIAAFSVLYSLLLTQRMAMKKAEGAIKRLRDYSSYRAE